MNLMAHFIACFAAVFATVISPSAFAQDNTVTVFAAASLKNAVDEITQHSPRAPASRWSQAMRREGDQGRDAHRFIG